MDVKDIWSSTLRSVSSSNALESYTLLIVGSSESALNAVTTAIASSSLEPSSGREQKSHLTNEATLFPFSYRYFDFGDGEDADDRISRLNVYTLGNDRQVNNSYLPFLKSVINKSKRDKLAIMILLDWESNNVSNWSEIIDKWLKLIKSATRGTDAAKEQIEKCEAHIKAYVAPGSDSMSDNAEVPLEKGQYSERLGVNVLFGVVGQEKAVGAFSKYSEATADFVRQYLRLIAWKCGASFIYLSSNATESQKKLVHLLSEQLAMPISTENGQQLPKRAYPDFEKDIVIPAGYDTKGKIEAVSEEFPFDILNGTWTIIEQEVDNAIVVQDTIFKDLYRSTVEEDENQEEFKKQYDDPSAATKTDFQDFLAQQYKLLESQRKEDNASGGIVAGSQLRRVVGGSSGLSQSATINGVQVSSGDTVRKLKAADAANPLTPDRSYKSESNTPQSSEKVTEYADSFFQRLLERPELSGGH